MLGSCDAVSGNKWPDRLRLSDIKLRFTCQACGTKALTSERGVKQGQISSLPLPVGTMALGAIVLTLTSAVL